MMIASLPMYDFPEVQHATNALWRRMVHHLEREGCVNVPRQLAHEFPVHDLWSDKNLIFGQCCGYDILNRCRSRLQVLGTPWFDGPCCGEGRYASIVVVPEDSFYQDVIDMPGTVAVINGPESHSGMNVLFALVAAHSRGNKFFSEAIVSGSHAESLAVVTICLLMAGC